MAVTFAMRLCALVAVAPFLLANGRPIAIPANKIPLPGDNRFDAVPGIALNTALTPGTANPLGTPSMPFNTGFNTPTTPMGTDPMTGLPITTPPMGTPGVQGGGGFQVISPAALPADIADARQVGQLVEGVGLASLPQLGTPAPNNNGMAGMGGIQTPGLQGIGGVPVSSGMPGTIPGAPQASTFGTPPMGAPAPQTGMAGGMAFSGGFGNGNDIGFSDGSGAAQQPQQFGAVGQQPAGAPMIDNSAGQFINPPTNPPF